MELRDLESYGEPGTVVLYLADRVELMRLMPDSCVDAVFADPPYRLSTGRGVTVKSGRLASVDKGSWDRSLGALYRRQRHVHDRPVQHDHDLRPAHQEQGQPSSPIVVTLHALLHLPSDL